MPLLSEAGLPTDMFYSQENPTNKPNLFNFMWHLISQFVWTES